MFWNLVQKCVKKRQAKRLAVTWWRRGESDEPLAHVPCDPFGFAPLRRNRYPLGTFARKTIRRIVFYLANLSEFDSLLTKRNKKSTPQKVCSFYLVETRRIELLSENIADSGSPSAVCDQNSLGCQFTNKLTASVASLFLADAKLSRLMCTAK